MSRAECAAKIGSNKIVYSHGISEAWITSGTPLPPTD